MMRIDIPPLAFSRLEACRKFLVAISPFLSELGPVWILELE